MIELALFASTFVVVFALGLQTLNVAGGHYASAFVTSFVIGASQLALYKLVPEANLLQVLAYLGGGPFGIVASMWAHRRFFAKKRRIDAHSER